MLSRFTLILVPWNLSIPLNGFAVVEVERLLEEATPFNSIEWILVYGENEPKVTTVDILSIPLNGFSEAECSICLWCAALSIPLNGFASPSRMSCSAPWTSFQFH